MRHATQHQVRVSCSSVTHNLPQIGLHPCAVWDSTSRHSHCALIRATTTMYAPRMPSSCNCFKKGSTRHTSIMHSCPIPAKPPTADGEHPQMACSTSSTHCSTTGSHTVSSIVPCIVNCCSEVHWLKAWTTASRVAMEGGTCRSLRSDRKNQR